VLHYSVHLGSMPDGAFRVLDSENRGQQEAGEPAILTLGHPEGWVSVSMKDGTSYGC
jgi:hypothetical protein